MSQINSSTSVFDPASPVRQAKPRLRPAEAAEFALPRPEIRAARAAEVSRHEQTHERILDRREARDTRESTPHRETGRELRREAGPARREMGAGDGRRADARAVDRREESLPKPRDAVTETASADAVSVERAVVNDAAGQQAAEAASQGAALAQAGTEAQQEKDTPADDTSSQIEAALIEAVQLAEPALVVVTAEALATNGIAPDAAGALPGTETLTNTGLAENAVAGNNGASGADLSGAAIAVQAGVASQTPQAASQSGLAGVGNDGPLVGAEKIDAQNATKPKEGAAFEGVPADAKLLDAKPGDYKLAQTAALETFAEALTQANQTASPTSRQDIPQSQVNPALATGAEAKASVAADQRPAPEATRPTPMHALPLEIGLQAMAGSKRFDIRLDPAELGRVDVRLEFNDDGTVTASLTADRVETLQMLQRDARTLERAFEQAGLKSSEGGIDFQLRDQSQGDRQAQRQQDAHQPQGRARRDEDETMTEMKSLDAAVLRRLARPGGVDLVI